MVVMRELRSTVQRAMQSPFPDSLQMTSTNISKGVYYWAQKLICSIMRTKYCCGFVQKKGNCASYYKI